MVTINHIFFLFENRLSCSLSIFGKIYTCCVQKSRKAWNGNSEGAINDESCFFFLWRLQTKSPKCMVLLYSQVKAKGPFEERKLFLSAHRDSDSCNIQHITWAGIEFYTLFLCAPLTLQLQPFISCTYEDWNSGLCLGVCLYWAFSPKTSAYYIDSSHFQGAFFVPLLLPSGELIPFRTSLGCSDIWQYTCGQEAVFTVSAEAPQSGAYIWWAHQHCGSEIKNTDSLNPYAPLCDTHSP